MKTLIESQIISDIKKARSGVYEDNRKNRKLGRVGHKYGSKNEEEKNFSSKELYGWKKTGNNKISREYSDFGSKIGIYKISIYKDIDKWRIKVDEFSHETSFLYNVSRTYEKRQFASIGEALKQASELRSKSLKIEKKNIEYILNPDSDFFNESLTSLEEKYLKNKLKIIEKVIALDEKEKQMLKENVK